MASIDTPADARGVTKLSGGADNIVWSSDGATIAFTSEVYPDCKDEACNVTRDEAREKSPVNARIYDRLLYRHWSSWSEGKRSHLFVVPAAGGTPRDLLPGADYDVPPPQREGPHPIAFAPDNRSLSFTAVTDRVEAISTNADLFEINVNGGEPQRLTTGAGFDGAPAYSPDGRTIAYRSQARAGYESDKWRLMLYDRTSARHSSLTDRFDRSVDELLWSSDGKSIYFNAEDRGAKPVFVIGVDSDTGTARALTEHNREPLAALDLAKAESFVFPGAGGDEVGGMLVRPPAFDATRKYPVLMLLHGGPQTQWGNTWSYRWNAQTFASPGYVAVLINRRGSTGAGQRFVDEITGDWGGKPLEDLMKGLDFVLRKYAFTDGRRVVG